jgi:hypothetical protein
VYVSNRSNKTYSMPNWRKVLVSGSDASLNTLTVVNGITGSLFGTASYAVSSFPYTGSAIISGSLIVTGSTNLSGLAQIDAPSIETGSILTINASISGSFAPNSGSGNIVHLIGPDSGTGGPVRITAESYGSGIFASPFFDARRARGTVGNPEPVLQGDNLLRISAIGWATTASYQGTTADSVVDRPNIIMYAAENFNSSSLGANIAFYTVPTGSVNNTLAGVFDGYGLQVQGSLRVSSTITLDATLTDYSTVVPSTAGTNTLFAQATGSYTSAFFKYTVSNSSNARAGEVMAVWNGTTVNYTDTSTTDIGNTSAVTCSAAVVGNIIQFNITTGTSGWRLKSLATYM